MKAYLVIKKSPCVERSLVEQYKVFIDRNKAVQHFVETIYYGGDVKVEFMPIEIQSETSKQPAI